MHCPQQFVILAHNTHTNHLMCKYKILSHSENGQKDASQCKPAFNYNHRFFIMISWPSERIKYTAAFIAFAFFTLCMRLVMNLWRLIVHFVHHVAMQFPCHLCFARCSMPLSIEITSCVSDLIITLHIWTHHAQCNQIKTKFIICFVIFHSQQIEFLMEFRTMITVISIRFDLFQCCDCSTSRMM